MFALRLGERRGANRAQAALIAAAGIGWPGGWRAGARFGGPGLAFGAAATIALVSIARLIGCADRPIARVAPPGAYRAARRGALLFVSDGWIISCAGWAWGLVVFRALGARFDAFGGRSPGGAGRRDRRAGPAA